MSVGLSEEEVERYSRQLVLSTLGLEGQLKLKDAKVCVVGLGGLGTPISLMLTAMGVGYLRIIDRDVVELSNLHRQFLYDTSVLDLPKVEVAAERLSRLNPNVKIEPLALSVNPDTAQEVVQGCDIVVDGLDSIEARYAINAACLELGVPYVYGSALGTLGAVSTIIPNETPCLECFYPNLRDDELPSCSVEGVHPSIISLVASIEVEEAVRLITGKEPHLKGRLLYINLEDLSFDTVNIGRHSKCPACSIPNPLARPALKRVFIQDLCARSGGKPVFVAVPREHLHLDIDDLAKRLARQGLKVVGRSRLSLRLALANEVNVTVLNSGVTLMVGVREEAVARELARRLLVEGAGVAWERVDESLRPIQVKEKV
jgi:adenylyltransferase/sulfurtransferase